MSHAAKALTHRALRRRHFVGLVVIATLLVWGAVWSIAAMRFNHAITRSIKDMQARGLTLTFEDRDTGGNPFTVDVAMRGFNLESASGAKIKADRATFYMNLWNWDAVSVKLRDNVQGLFAGIPFEAGIVKFGFAYPERTPLSYRETGLSLWVQPFILKLNTEKPLAFGNTIEEGLFSVSIKGPVPDFANKESVAAWNDASGVFEFDRFFLHWGPINVTANGTVGLNANLQPEGAFSGRIDGLDQAVDALARQGAITKRQEALVRSSIDVLSRPSGLTGNSAPVVPVSLQGGGLYLGPVKLMKLPEINWD
jgi:hypothetical protein